MSNGENEIVYAKIQPAQLDSTVFPRVVATSNGNVLVQFLGSLRSDNAAVVRTQLDLGEVDTALKSYVGKINLTEETLAENKVTLHIGHSQTLVGTMVKLKKPLALLRPKEITSGVLNAEIVHYKVYFGAPPMPRVGKPDVEVEYS